MSEETRVNLAWTSSYTTRLDFPRSGGGGGGSGGGGHGGSSGGQPSGASDDDDELQVVGERSWAERDAALRAQALALSDSDADEGGD